LHDTQRTIATAALRQTSIAAQRHDIYPADSGQGFQAIYFDNEGHVIHYDVSTPDPGAAVFLSPLSHGPQFLSTDKLKRDVMTGRFQMQMPGRSDWHTYLEWSGSHK
jgi:hypothetical protein